MYTMPCDKFNFLIILKINWNRSMSNFVDQMCDVGLLWRNVDAKNEYDIVFVQNA